MIEEIKLPEIAENVESGSVITVHVKAGDAVSQDDPLIEIETEKAAVEVPSTVDGTVSEVLVSEGDDVKVGATIVKVDTEGGGEEAGKPAEEEAAPEAETEPEKAEEPAAQKTGPSAEGPGVEPAGPEEAPAEAAAQKPAQEKPAGEDRPGRKAAGEKAPEAPGAAAAEKPLEPSHAPVPASPSVRRLARELGVDINTVEGSGPAGRISHEDVKAHTKRMMTGAGGAPKAAPGVAAGAAAGKPELPDFSRWGTVRREAMSNVRKITARNMQSSWQTIPHVTQFDKADVTELESFRKRYAAAAEKAGGKLTVTAILLKVTGEALKRFPDFNASIDMRSEEIVYKDYVNIGVAVDTDRGLLVPVVRDVPSKSIVELSVELSDIARKAREKKIKPDELEGGNFTISNLGGIGGTAFTPVVYSPQVAILGVARSEYQPVFQNGSFEPRLILPLSLSYDHRLIDGANGARFVRWIAQSLENPLYMSLEGGSK
jgi:pyruvate dehydrogenase E2 component (dihydrolipoamide acetyltransferase)